MKIASIDVFVLGFPFKSVFVLAGGVAGEPTRCRIVCSSSSPPTAVSAGWGEATPTPRWTYETTETIVSTLRKYLAPAVIGIEIWNLDALHRAMERAINPGVTTGSPLAKSAIDVAAHDALGRALERARLQAARRVPAHSIRPHLDGFGATPADEAERLVGEGLDAGYTMFDAKIGMHGEHGDLELLRRAPQGSGRSQLCRSMRTVATGSTPRCGRRGASRTLASPCSNNR